MLVLDLGEFFSKGLVTVEAECLAFLDQAVLVVGRMGVVAFHTATIGHHLVDTARFGGDHGRMAERTDRCGAGREHLAVGGGMGVVAAGTLFLFERRMDHLPGHLLFEAVMAVQAKIAPCSGLELELLIGSGRQALSPGGQHYHGQQ